MTPNVNPEQAAELGVVSNGGYDPCTFGVIIKQVYLNCLESLHLAFKGMQLQEMHKYK